MLRPIAILALASLAVATPAYSFQSLDVPDGPTFGDNIPKKKQPRSSREIVFEKSTTIELKTPALVICSEGAASGEDLENALASCNAAIKESPESGDAFYYRGFVNFHLDRKTEAESDFTSAIELASPRAAESYYQRGVCKEQRRKLREAAQDFKKALELKPEWSAARRKVEEYQWAYE